MPKKLDLTNKKFGLLTAIEPIPERKHGGLVWKCQCDCGNIIYVTASHLNRGETQSCGCTRGKKNIKNLSGQRFGKLVAIKYTGFTRHGSAEWECQCDCGNTILVDSHSLVKGNTQSCGCLKSTGEEKILQILNSLQIKYEYQKSFENCQINERKLKFDFYLPKYNIIIEYDGAQHFQPVEYMGGEERFKKQQKFDNYKNNWCLENNIKLIRIPYYDKQKLNEDYLKGKIFNEN